jgi:hypothetical protein
MAESESGARRMGRGVAAFLPAAIGTLVILLVLAFSLPPHSPSGAFGEWNPAGWSDGTLTVSPARDHPAVTVAAASASERYGLYAGVGWVNELAPGGAVRASATLGDGRWTMQNLSGPTGLTLNYVARLNVTEPGQVVPIGVAGTFVNFTLEPPTSSPSVTGVEFSIAVTQWPWVATQDRLAIVMPLWPSDPSAAYLAEVAGLANMIDCNPTGSSTPLEFFAWADHGTAVTAGGGSVALAASTSISGGASATNVTVLFSGTPGGYTVLRYDPTVGLTLPSAPHPLSLAVLGAITGGGVAAALVGAWSLLRVSRRPPSLMWAE